MFVSLSVLFARLTCSNKCPSIDRLDLILGIGNSWDCFFIDKKENGELKELEGGKLKESSSKADDPLSRWPLIVSSVE